MAMPLNPLESYGKIRGFSSRPPSSDSTQKARHGSVAPHSPMNQDSQIFSICQSNKREFCFTVRFALITELKGIPSKMSTTLIFYR